MSEVIDVIAWLLVPMGLLPVLTTLVLWSERKSNSPALRERARLSGILAVLGVIVALLALNRLLEFGISGTLLVAPLGVALILVDLASGLWLWEYLRGRFG